MSDRDEFEKFALDRLCLAREELKRGYGDWYVYEKADMAWSAWQAAREQGGESQAPAPVVEALGVLVSNNLRPDVQGKLKALINGWREQQGGEAVAWPCWSCTSMVSMHERSEADGDCPKCGAELDLDLWPNTPHFASSVSNECSMCHGDGGICEPGSHSDAVLMVCPMCDGDGDAPHPQPAALPDGARTVTTDWLKRVRRDLDACQKLIWGNLQGCDPAYCADAQARLAEIDEILTAQPAKVPEGWKLVPCHADTAMIRIGKRAHKEEFLFHQDPDLNIQQIWKAMIAFSPAPPEGAE